MIEILEMMLEEIRLLHESLHPNCTEGIGHDIEREINILRIKAGM